MLKAGTETGSVMNHVMSRSNVSEVKIGDGATILQWTDRSAGTVVKITPTQIHVQEDNTVRIDSNGMSESQTYEYSPNPEGKVHVFRKTNKGYRNVGGNGLAVGQRNKYHDFYF